MHNTVQNEIWFITGTQLLYGEETLLQVNSHAQQVANYYAQQGSIPMHIVYKGLMKSQDEITSFFKEANYSTKCIGVIMWMHTFSPSKMWINGLKITQLPLLHLHTQYNKNIPFADIDMNFMNLNQSAHGDREMAFMLARMNVAHKVVVGHWQEKNVVDNIASWSRVAIGLAKLKSLKVVRFGDNMREVGVTEGDKVEAQIKFGFTVNTHGVGDLVKVINEVSDTDINKLIIEYETQYYLTNSLRKDGAQRSSLIEAARIELGLKYFLQDGNYGAYTNTFEDLHGMRQLPGIGSQRLMAAGYGYGGEGDWKTSAMVYMLKTMAIGMPGGNSFMEDYTYHFDPSQPMVLGSHMLEICPSIAEGKVNCEVHPLGIGGKEDPVRLVFNGAAGDAINVSLIDLGHRFRLLVNEVVALPITEDFPKLPTARVLWQPQPSMEVGLQAWLIAGGAHHTVYSQNITTAQMEDFAEIMNIEIIVINKDTKINELKQLLRSNEAIYK
jgi:L-arabinose isomerase